MSWPSEDGCVKAWYPFVGLGKTLEKNITDQSNGYHDIDFLYAVTGEMNYKKTVDLNFKHQMAKVSCKLIKGDGVTDEDLTTAKVSYAGYPIVSFKEGTVTGSYFEGKNENEWISSTSDFTALLVPQDMSGKPFIKVNLTVTVNDVPIDKELIYTPEQGKGTLEAGKAYTLNITVKKDRLVVQTISGAWTESPDATEPTSDKYQIYLPENTEKLGELEFSKNVITEGTADTRAGSGRLVEVIGDSFTITFKPTLKNCDLGLVFVDKNTTNRVIRNFYEIPNASSVDGVDGYYEFTYTIASPIEDPVYLEIGEHIEIGDILFQDGSWGSISKKIYESEELPDKDKKVPVGIVFKIGAGGDGEGQKLDVPGTYNKCEGWNGHKIRGYAVALKDASDQYVRWSSSNTTIFPKTDSIDKYYSGLHIANRLKEIIPTKKLTISSNFPAFQKAEDYTPVAPKGTSGWYLPSYHQLKDIRRLFEHPLRKKWFPNAGGNFFDLKRAYCSATEQNQTSIYIDAFVYDGDYAKLIKTVAKTNPYVVRSVLTF